MSRPEFTSKKDVAMMFYKWGITVGNKLAGILAKENESDMKRPEDIKRHEPIERSVLNEGISAVIIINDFTCNILIDCFSLIL